MAEIVLELFIIEAQVIDSDDFVGMIVESVAIKVSLSSVMGMQLILRHWILVTIVALNFIQLELLFSFPQMLVDLEHRVINV